MILLYIEANEDSEGIAVMDYHLSDKKNILRKLRIKRDTELSCDIAPIESGHFVCMYNPKAGRKGLPKNNAASYILGKNVYGNAFILKFEADMETKKGMIISMDAADIKMFQEIGQKAYELSYA